ncbi:MAG: hypothetical protein DWQ02_16915 [Bacteroidetes bacterium]|nr:MAG: hypothetical protein DWQ02_16915 [Bacteroidota bacterium]
MAMNNWGGIKEHMTKKPRKLFGNRKKKESLPKGKTKNRPADKLDEEKIHSTRKNYVIRNILTFLIFAILMGWLTFYLLNKI